MSSERIWPVVIVGAGPAGLSLGHEFGLAGMRPCILERGPAPADSWRRMPRHMPMNSPWGASLLAGSRVGLRRWSQLASRAEFHAYLLDYARRHDFEIWTDTAVKGIELEEGSGFRLATSRGPVHARTVVNATGYFGHPFVPSYAGLEQSDLVQITVPEYGDAEQVASRLGPSGRDILIVGKRITAGQLGIELVDAGFDVTVSHRSPIRYGWDPNVQRRGFPLYYPYERVRLRSQSWRHLDSRHPMQGGRARKLIESGRIRTAPEIERVRGSRVLFRDGSSRRFAGLVWATGYRPALPHLGDLVSLDPETGRPPLRGAESAEVPGLFFLGLDQQTDFTSRMLRGIRRDARKVATRVLERLRP